MDSLRNRPAHINARNEHPLKVFNQEGYGQMTMFTCFKSNNFDFSIGKFASMLDSSKLILIKNCKESFHKDLINQDPPDCVKRFVKGTDGDGVDKLSIGSHDRSSYVVVNKSPHGDYCLYPYQHLSFEHNDVILLYSYLFCSYEGKSTSMFVSLHEFGNVTAADMLKSRFSNLLQEL